MPTVDELKARMNEAMSGKDEVAKKHLSPRVQRDAARLGAVGQRRERRL
jgi:hypothetical protein